MTKWELARYLIDAKKCVDSVLFIAENIRDLRNLSLAKIVEDRQREFYINVKVVYDKSFLSSAERKRLKEVDDVYNDTCRERDKNYAHKDDSYRKPDYKSIKEIADTMKARLIHCRKLCEASLPDVITLDFACYDRDLFRFIYKIDPDMEEKIEDLRRLMRGDVATTKDASGITLNVLYDTEDIKKIQDPSKYAVIIKDGLTVHEAVQERQDASIRINALHGENMWMTPSAETKRIISENPRVGKN